MKPRQVPAAAEPGRAGADLASSQLEHWQESYSGHPGMYGDRPSGAARSAADVVHGAGATDILELGSGPGRDALFFACSGFAVQAVDFSSVTLTQLRDASRAANLDALVSTLRGPSAAAASRCLGRCGLRAHASVHGTDHPKNPQPGP